MNTNELAQLIKEAIGADPSIEWVNSDQDFWDNQDGHVRIGVDGLLDCTVIAEHIEKRWTP